MEDKRMNLYKATEFETIRDVIRNAVKKYPENNAFILKNKKDKTNDLLAKILLSFPSSTEYILQSFLLRY